MNCINLVCCIYPSKIHRDICDLMLYYLMSMFGTVKNIKILSPTEHLKAFVQILSNYSTQQIIEKLNKKSLTFAKIKIYESRKQHLTFDKPLVQLLSEKYSKAKESHNTNLMEKIFKEFELLKQNIDKEFNNKKLLQEKNSEVNISPSNHEYIFNNNSNEKQNYNNFPLKEFNISSLKITNTETTWEARPLNDNSNSDSPFTIDEPMLLKVNGLNPEVISCRMLANLFGCFGNIKGLWYLKDKGQAFIEFDKQKYVIDLINSVQLIGCFDSEIFLSLTNRKSFLDQLESISTNCKFLKGTVKFGRFKDQNKKPFTSLTNSLCMPKIANLDIESVCRIVSEVYQPKKVMEGRFASSNTEYFIIEFSEISQSIEFLCLMHNKRIFGWKFQLEFIDERNLNLLDHSTYNRGIN